MKTQLPIIRLVLVNGYAAVYIMLLSEHQYRYVSIIGMLPIFYLLFTTLASYIEKE